MKLYSTAIHEAGHAVMSLHRRVVVTELVINEAPDDNGLLGYCRHVLPPFSMDSLWITLAGPVITAIQEGREGVRVFADGDWADFEGAWGHCLKLFQPPIPEAYRELAGDEPESFFYAVADGWRPKGVKGAAKRKLTLFARRFGDASDMAKDYLHDQKNILHQYVETSPHIMEAVRFLADVLMERRRLDGQELLTVCQSSPHIWRPVLGDWL